MSLGISLISVGAGLQVLGVIAAGDGVRRTRVIYAPERLGIWRQVKKWFGSLGRIFRHQQPLAEPAVGKMATDLPAVSFDGRGVVELGPDATTEQRVDFLTTQVTALQSGVGHLERNLVAQSRKWQEELVAVRAAVSEEAAQSRRQVKEAKADGLAQEAIGLWCVGIGVIVAFVGALML
ncbi:hypothetical protein ACFW61_35605 [Streptomyces microflavus]|uniref:hypothetical protein n=1 Tax=Streptomyces microflavus TaxID=1919 RepID=UPI0036D0E346